jgi:hypothetical protein
VNLPWHEFMGLKEQNMPQRFARAPSQTASSRLKNTVQHAKNEVSHDNQARTLRVGDLWHHG